MSQESAIDYGELLPPAYRPSSTCKVLTNCLYSHDRSPLHCLNAYLTEPLFPQCLGTFAEAVREALLRAYRPVVLADALIELKSCMRRNLLNSGRHLDCELVYAPYIAPHSFSFASSFPSWLLPP